MNILMNENNLWADLKERTVLFTKQIVCIFIDVIFLCLWVIVQYLTNEIIILRLKIYGVDIWVYRTFQIIFLISTLIPVVAYIYSDLFIIIIRTRRRIKQEWSN